MKVKSSMVVKVSTIKDKEMYRFPSKRLYRLKQNSKYPSSAMFIEMLIKEAQIIVLKTTTINASIDETTKLEKIMVFLLWGDKDKLVKTFL